jgi:hypothetical protein
MLLIPLLIRLWKAFKDRSRQAGDDGGDSFAASEGLIRPPSGGGG